MGPAQQYEADFILFVESGFIAASQADEDSALKLFRAAQFLDPKNHLPKIGFGYIHFLKLELQKASRHFEEVLKENPNNEMASALLGLTIAMTVKEVNKGEKILEEVLKNTEDGTVKEMASTAISFIERFIKKQPTPAQITPKAKKEKRK